MEAVVFFVSAALALGAALGVVAFRDPFYSVLSLVVNLIALAALFLLLHAEFVAAAQIIVYVGAVLVMYVFVVAYVGRIEEAQNTQSRVVTVTSGLFALALFIELSFSVLSSALVGVDDKGAALGPGFGSPGQIGELFLTKFLLPFEVASILLLSAAVGALVLARRREDPAEGGI